MQPSKTDQLANQLYIIHRSRTRSRKPAMANQSSILSHVRLNLPEVVELMVAHLGCTKVDAQDFLERALYSGSLKDIRTFYPDGMEIETDIPFWRDIDWDTGIVMIEPSWAGSPVVPLPVFPMFDLREVCSCFDIDINQQKQAAVRRGGRPAQYDWDAFWVEVCRRTHEEGLPETQASLVDEMVNWFICKGQERIDSRTIEKKISRLYQALIPK
jgi:hypothetical protein